MPTRVWAPGVKNSHCQASSWLLEWTAKMPSIQDEGAGKCSTWRWALGIRGPSSEDQVSGSPELEMCSDRIQQAGCVKKARTGYSWPGRTALMPRSPPPPPRVPPASASPLAACTGGGVAVLGLDGGVPRRRAAP